MDGKTIFHTASINGFSELFDLIEKININIDESDTDLNTPLHQAIINNSPKMVDLIIKHGANINICNRLFQTPILLACSEISSTKNLSEIIKMLIATRVNLKVRDRNMKTIFHYLVEKQNIEILKYIFRNIPIATRKKLSNYQDDCYNSPLHIAAKLGNVEICQLLIDAGANPMLFSQKDELALNIATSYGHLDIVKLLLKLNPETAYFRDINESCVILQAAKEGKFEIFKYLIDSGQDCLAKDEFGRNTLMFASRSGSLSIVEYLLNKEMNTNLHDQLKNTALHQAAEEGHLEIVKHLWHYGAVLSDNVYGHTALDVALISKKDDIARFFLNEKNWKHVMAFRHENGDSHIENLIKYNEEITLELMNKCITENVSNKLDPNYEVKYYFGILDAGPDDSASINSRYYALLSMAKYRRLNLLNSPLALQLYLEKWYKYGLIIYIADFMLYLIYLIGITIYVTSISPMQDDDLYDPISGCKIIKSNETISRSEAESKVLVNISVLFIISLIRNIWRFMKLLGQKRYFFLNFWNYLFIFCDILLILLMRDPSKLFCLYEWQICPGLIFLSYFLVLYYLQYIPVIGIHVMMFLKVLITVTKVLISFTWIGIGFAIGFYIMNSNQPPFQNPGLAMIKSASMMIGEMDLVAYFTGNKKNYFYTSIVMSTIFLIIMPITLFNLIVGLAVGDINEMALEASLEVKKMKINFAWSAESNLFVQIQRYLYNSEVIKRPKQKKKDSASIFELFG